MKLASSGSSEGGMIRLETLIELEIYQFEFFELSILLKGGNQLSIERFEPTVSQSTVSFPPLTPNPPTKSFPTKSP